MVTVDSERDNVTDTPFGSTFITSHTDHNIFLCDEIWAKGTNWITSASIPYDYSLSIEFQRE